MKALTIPVIARKQLDKLNENKDYKGIAKVVGNVMKREEKGAQFFIVERDRDQDGTFRYHYTVSSDKESLVDFMIKNMFEDDDEEDIPSLAEGTYHEMNVRLSDDYTMNDGPSIVVSASSANIMTIYSNTSIMTMILEKLLILKKCGITGNQIDKTGRQ